MDEQWVEQALAQADATRASWQSIVTKGLEAVERQRDAIPSDNPAALALHEQLVHKWEEILARLDDDHRRRREVILGIAATTRVAE